MSPKSQLEHDKRQRREIANENERRRMKCINKGFEHLKALMPQLNGEKLSKVSGTVKYCSSGSNCHLLGMSR
jgi:transcription factor AP-4